MSIFAKDLEDYPADADFDGRPTKPVWRVVWDNGADACDTFPFDFDTEEEAETFGENWLADFNVENYTAEEVADGLGGSYDVVEGEARVDPPEEWEDESAYWEKVTRYR